MTTFDAVLVFTAFTWAQVTVLYAWLAPWSRPRSPTT